MSNENITQMGDGLYVKVNTMTPWELTRLNFRLANGPNVKYRIDEVEN